MTFLNPFLLLGLLGVAVPVLIHLLSRRTAHRVDFSSLEFLRKLERKSMRRMRVRQWLLLAIRMLIIAAVALAMARPTLVGVAAGSGKGATSAVLVLDASFSMGAESGGRPLFEAARERALAILDTFERGDEIVLLIPGAEEADRTEGVRDLALLRERIRSARPGTAAVDLAAVVRESAARLSEARYPSREIHIVSDFQRSAWPGLEEGAALPEGLGLFLFPVGEGSPPQNAWVESVDFSGQILEMGSPVELRVVVASGPGFDPRELELELEIDDAVVDRRRIDLGPAARVTVAFRHTFAADGLHLGTVSLGGDAGIEGDDVRHFSLRTARAVPVLLVGPDEAATRYLQAALAPAGAAAGTFAVRRGETRDLVAAATDEVSVVILSDVERLSEEELVGLKRYLSDGGGLLVFPGPRMDAAAWSRSFLPRLLPARLSDLRSLEEGFTVSRLDASHPLFSIFRDHPDALSEVRFTRALSMAPQAGTSALATYSTDEPAILESTLLPGRVLFFTSSLDPAWSDLPLTGVFLPLLHESIRYLSETRSRAAETLDVGDGATVRVASVPDGAGVTLRSPGGETRAVAISPTAGGYALELPVADAAGFWMFETAAGDTLAALAASVAAAESDPEPIPAADVERVLTGGRSAVLESPEGLGRQLREARIGREIGEWFLWAAAFLLIAEMVLASRRREPMEKAA